MILSKLTGCPNTQGLCSELEAVGRGGAAWAEEAAALVGGYLTVVLSYCYPVSLSHFYTAALSHRHTVTLSHCHTVTLYFHTVTLFQVRLRVGMIEVYERLSGGSGHLPPPYAEVKM